MQNSEYELPAAEGTPNGEVGAMDLKQLQKEKQDLEQQLTEKNKIMKQMQQRMLELKKTLQKELVSALHIQPYTSHPQTPLPSLDSGPPWGPWLPGMLSRLIAEIRYGLVEVP